MDMIGKVEFSYKEATSEYSYEWNFGDKSLEEFLIFSTLGNNNYAACTEEIKFQTGVLATTDHYMKFFINGNGEVYAKICLGSTKFNQNEEFTECAIYKSTITLHVKERNNSTTVLPLAELEHDEKNNLGLRRICRPEELRGRFHNQAIVFWYRSTKSPSNFWGYCYSDKDIIRRQKYIKNSTFKLEFFHRFWHKDALSTQTDLKNYGTQHGRQNAGKLDVKPYFLSKEFSDFVIECGGKQFPVHRIILASKSQVFANMFQQPLKEKQEGRLIIEDSEPKVVEEFLKFLYTGDAKLEEYAAELILISDKKKNDLIKTSEDIKRFSEEYPELMLKFTRGEI